MNYRTETACVSAVTRFHDSRFQGIKLVCRLRRGASSELNNRETLSPPLPAASGSGENEIDESHGELVPNYCSKDQSLLHPTVKHRERYFIVKSLTIEDLERSRVSGVWATQRHNEVVLNHAYEVGKLLYPYDMNYYQSSRICIKEAWKLTFSTNKSELLLTLFFFIFLVTDFGGCISDILRQ